MRPTYRLKYNKLFYEYNTVTDKWSVIPSLTHAGRTYSGYAQINQYGFLFGGIDSLNVIHSSFEKIDLQNYVITPMTAFNDIARKGCMTFTGSDAFYLTTGVSNTTRFQSTRKIAQIIGLEDLTFNHAISVYPNPTTERLTIQSTNANIKNCYIYDSYGKLVYQKEVNEKEVQLNFVLSKGVYLLKVFSTKDDVSNHKIVIN